MRIAFAMAAAVFTLASCGGGGSGSGPVSMLPPPPEMKPPPPPPEIPSLMLGASFGRTGQDYYPLNARFQKIKKPTREEYNREFYEAALEHYEDGTCCWEMAKEASPIASRADVLAMLNESIYSFEDIVDINADPDDPPGVDGNIYGYKISPIVQIVSGSGPKGALQRAIDNINAWLPYRQHITIGANLSANAEHPGENVIRADLNTALEDDPDAGGTGGFGQINIRGKENTNVNLITHELLHALGIYGARSCYETFGSSCDGRGNLTGPARAYSHVPVARFPESTMAYVSPYWDGHGLSQIDGETLQTIYTKLHGKRGTSEDKPAVFWIDETISAADLGPWDDTVIRYRGSLPIESDYRALGENTVDNRRFWHSTGQDPLSIGVAYGVDWRNGMARPWAIGESPGDDFVASGLSGSATWTGELVGFTPLQEAVHGDSAIVVELARRTGNAAFTALEHWNAGAAPGGPGTGAQWGDGDLHYSFALDGVHLRSNGGDEGYVSGRFVGGRAQGAVGILERSDLTAAFGASR